MGNVGKFQVMDNGVEDNLTKVHDSDAGLDLKSAEATVVPARGKTIVKTGIKVAIPDGCFGLLYSRSGLSAKHGIQIGAGIVDQNYRGELMCVMYNHSDTDFTVNYGDRIAQLLTIPINISRYEKVDSLDETDRGDKRFGSSGVQ